MDTPQPDNREHELFIVEGVSAANAVENVCLAEVQHVFAMQGKPMNVLRASPKEIAKNGRVDQLVRRITRNKAEGFDSLQPAFTRVILLSDADVDGVHAKALLLAMIGHVLPDLITTQRLCTVRAPRYAVECDQMDSPVWAYTPDGQQSVKDQMYDRKYTNVTSRHFKGIASMDADDIWAACVNPESRKISPLTAEHLNAAQNALR